MDKAEIFTRTQEAITAMSMAVLRSCENGNVDEAATYMEIIATITILALNIVSGDYKKSDYSEWDMILREVEEYTDDTDSQA